MAKDVIITPSSGSLVFSGSTSPLSSSFISDESGSLTLYLEKEGNQSFKIDGSGSTIFEINGASGPLFSIQDSLSGSLFSVTNATGFPIFEVFSDNTVKIGTYDEEAITVNGTTAIVKGLLSGSGGAELVAGKYNFGYDLLPSYPLTGSGLIVSSSNLPADHYNMVKIGETELIDFNTLLTPNTFFIHNVDNIIIASGSEPVDIYNDGPGKLFEHTGDSFKVYSGGSPKFSLTSGSSVFTHDISVLNLYLTSVPVTTPEYVAVWDGIPSPNPNRLKYITSSYFTGGSSTPYCLGTFGGSYNWTSTESNTRIVHGFTNGPTAGATANDENWGPWSPTDTIDVTTETFNTYKMQYFALYSPVAGVPHIKAWGRSNDADFATNGCEIGVSIWSLGTEPNNGDATTETATLRASSPMFAPSAGTIYYLGNGMEASGSQSLPAGTFYFVTFDLSGSLVDNATLRMNFTLWLE